MNRFCFFVIFTLIELKSSWTYEYDGSVEGTDNILDLEDCEQLYNSYILLIIALSTLNVVWISFIFILLLYFLKPK